MYLTKQGETHTNKLNGFEYYSFSSDELTDEQRKFGIFLGTEVNSSQIQIDINKKNLDIQSQIDKLYQQKKNELKISENNKIKQGFLYRINGVYYRFDADEKGQRFLNGLVTMKISGQLTTDFGPFTTWDNQEITIPNIDIIPIGISCIEHIRLAHSVKKQKEGDLDIIYNDTIISLNQKLINITKFDSTIP